jgi:hypothetical protein
MSYVALEVQYPDESWRTIVLEERDDDCVCYDDHDGTTYRVLAAGEDYTMYDYNYCSCDNHGEMWLEADGDYWKLHVDISHYDFTDKIQVEMETLASKFNIDFRFVWKDGAGVNIDQLDQEFAIEFTDSTGHENLCADATVESYSSTRDKYLAFAEYDDWTADERRYVEFENTFKTKSDTDGCDAVYKCYVYDSDMSDYVELWQLENTLRDQTTAWSSHLSFDSETGNLIADFSRSDIVELIDFFTNDNDEVVMEFEVVAIVPQSNAAGPESGYDSLPSATFKLFIVSNEDVKECRDNSLDLLDETED